MVAVWKRFSRPLEVFWNSTKTHVLIWCFDHDGGEWQQDAPKSLIGLSGWMMVIAKAVAYDTHYFYTSQII